MFFAGLFLPNATMHYLVSNVITPVTPLFIDNWCLLAAYHVLTPMSFAIVSLHLANMVDQFPPIISP